MDSEYLRASVGTVLAKGIAETVVARPEDPIGYLAAFLLKSVADEKADKELTELKKADTAASDKAAAAAAEETAKADEKATALATQVEKEDKRLDNLLENAGTSDEVFNAVLSYGRARTGASGYVMLTDLSEKIMPKKEPEAPPASEEPAEGAEGEEPPAEPAAEEEPPEPRPPFKPGALEYVAATSSDEALLIGKTLDRPPAPAEEDEGAPPAPAGVGEGVTFTAIDDFIGGGAKVFHEPSAVQNRSVKFFYMPRMGAYACAPFGDFEGDVRGVLGFDTLGLERAFTSKELELFESLAARTGETLTRIEAGLAEQHHALMETLTAAYPKSEEGAYPTFTPEEGMDPIEAAKGAVAIPAGVLATLTNSALAHLETRRKLDPAVLLVLKGVLAITSPDMAAEMPEATWDGIKEGIAVGEILWHAELFAAIGSFDVMAGAGGAGWDAAKAMAAALSTPPEEGEAPIGSLTADPSLLLGKVLCDWLLAVCELHTKKAEADAAACAPEEPAEEAQE